MTAKWRAMRLHIPCVIPGLDPAIQLKSQILLYGPIKSGNDAVDDTPQKISWTAAAKRTWAVFTFA